MVPANLGELLHSGRCHHYGSRDILMWALIALSQNAQVDAKVAMVLEETYNESSSSSSSTQVSDTETNTLKPSSPKSNGKQRPNGNDVLDFKVDTIIHRVFGGNDTTMAPESNTPSDVDHIVNQIFNPTPTTQRPSVPFREAELCVTESGQPGVCVLYYMCGPNQTLFAYGKYQIDIRAEDSSCVSYLDTCCLLEDDAGNKITEKPETKRQGCGWRNTDGVKNFTSSNMEGKTKFGEFPWMCAVITIKLLSDAKTGVQKIGDVYVGGGSLIHHSVVLTAAHYVFAASRLRVRAGAWDSRNSDSGPLPYQLRQITNIDIHKDFKRDNLIYDVALLYLSAPMVPAANVRVVCLPPPRERIPAGTRCFATGWGKDKYGKHGQYQVVLKKVEVPVIGRATCENQLRKTRLGEYFLLHPSFMCAGGEKDKDVCKGDGGSPLSCPIEAEEGRYVQSGIVAWGIQCGEPGIPGVYVDVSSFRSWIDENVIRRGYDPKVYSI